MLADGNIAWNVRVPRKIKMISEGPHSSLQNERGVVSLLGSPGRRRAREVEFQPVAKGRWMPRETELLMHGKRLVDEKWKN